MTEPSRAVFLSYASQDAESARCICEALRAAGIEVWFDQSELRGGDAWDQKIRREVHDCALFIPVISANTATRHEGYFRLEWNLADQRTQMMARDRAFIVPVCIDSTPDSGTDVPESFVRVQWTRLPGGEAPPAFVTRISQLLSPSQPQAQVPPPTVSAPASHPTTPNATASRRGRLVALLIVAVSLMAGGYVAFDKFIVSKHVAGPVVPAINPASPTQSTIPEKSIAVLPFVDLSEKHDQEYFADGMAEEIINLLVKIPDLKVIGRTSSFGFKGKTDDLRTIGATLGAVYVVEGSVRRSGEHVRVTAQLIDARDGTHRWSDTYDRDASNVLQVQDEIAASLVRALQVEVADAVYLQARSPLTNRKAYDNYLRGLHALDRRDPPGFEQAVAEFRGALELVPSFIPAAEALALVLRDQAYFGFVRPDLGYEQARVAATAVLNISPKSAIAHAVLLAVHTEYDWDWLAAEQELKTAVALAPNNPTVLLYAAEERLAVGQWDESMRFLDSASTVDPLYTEVYFDRSLVCLRLDRLPEAESALRRLLEISPTAAWGHYYLAIVLLVEGKADSALTEMQRESPVGGEVAGLAVVYYALHRSKDADAALAHLEANNAGDNAMGIAEAYAYRGQKDKALQWLDRAYVQKDINLWYIKGDPLLKNLEGDPRYKAFLRKMNVPQ